MESLRLQVDRVPHPHAEIGGDLIVPGARRVQSSCGFADEFAQSRFHVHVDVLERSREFECAVFDL